MGSYAQHSITLRGRAQRVRAKLQIEGQSGTVPMVVQAIYPSPARRVLPTARVAPEKPVCYEVRLATRGALSPQHQLVIRKGVFDRF